MCEVNQTLSKIGTSGGLGIELTCIKTGKPITVTTEFGMFCEDRCDYEEAKAIGVRLKTLCNQVSSFIEILDGHKSPEELEAKLEEGYEEFTRFQETLDPEQVVKDPVKTLFDMFDHFFSPGKNESSTAKKY